MSVQKRAGTGNYQLVVRVPADLVASYGKAQIRESLKTANYREAQRLHAIRLGELAEEFEAKRNELRGIVTYSREDLRAWARMAARRLDDDLRRSNRIRPVPPTLPELRSELASAPQTALICARDFIKLRDLCVPEDSDTFAYFVGCVRNYLEDQVALDIRVLLGQEVPQLIAVRQPGADPVPTGSDIERDDDSNLGKNGRKLALIQAIEEFKSTPAFTSKAVKTQFSYAQSFTLLCRLFGEGRLVHTITPPDMTRLQWVIDHIPLYCPSAGDLVARCEGNANSEKPSNLAPKTKDRHVTATRLLFGHLTERWFIQFDPSRILHGYTDDGEGAVKIPFTDDDLKAIFNKPVIHKNDRSSVYFWVPLLALHTGARRNELCQLQPHDIIKVDEDGGRWCINITSDPGGRRSPREGAKTTKNAGSKRIIPVHSTLLRLGFLDLVEKSRGNRNGRIFRELSFTPVNKWSGKFDKTFHRRLDDAIVRSHAGTRKSFHSFRHYVTDRLKDAEIDPGVIDALLGWTTEERNVAMRDYYGNRKNERSPFMSLVMGIESLCYPWLAL